MVNHALEEVVNEERNIQIRIKEGQRKAAEWLAREKIRVSKETRERSAALDDQCRAAIEQAEAEAAREVAGEVLKARKYRKSLASLPEVTLVLYLKKHLPRILPEEKP